MTHSDISIGEFDRYGLEEAILDDPGAFGFTNVVDSACPDCTFLNPSPDPTTIVPNPDEYFVWDALELGHKTGRVHQLLGDGAFESLPAERIQIDIKPGSDPNSVNLKSKGVLPIAILSTEAFDALSVDVSTLRFGDSLLIREGGTPVSALRSAVEDINGDGLDDVSVKVSVPDLVDQGALGAMTFAGSLTGATWDGSAIVGFDRIRVVNGSFKGVPEPSSLLLGICGWICLVIAQRSRK